MKMPSVLVLFAALAVNVAGKEPAAPTAKGLSVHEWGVFRVSEDAEFANAALRAEWDDLPGFAYGFIKGRVVPQHWGAFEDEAKSLVAIWKARLFETPGLNLFYRLPQAEYDALMPLTVTPNPESIVRVGLIEHSHLEPDFAQRVLELVKQLDAPKFAARDAALKKLLAIGPAALGQLQRIGQRKDLSAEVKERIDALVRKWSAREAFDK